jgi:hypothetical protein
MPKVDLDEVARVTAKLREEEAERYRQASKPGVYRAGAGDGDRAPDESPGTAFINSAVYRSWMGRFRDGGPPQGAHVQSDPVAVRMAAHDDGGAVLRTLITSADTSAGSWVAPDRGPLVPGVVRPLTIRNLLTVIPTTSDQIDFPREVSRVNAAAPVAEASALRVRSPKAGWSSRSSR